MEWTTGHHCSQVATSDDGSSLYVRRSDNGRWFWSVHRPNLTDVVKWCENGYCATKEEAIATAERKLTLIAPWKKPEEVTK